MALAVLCQLLALITIQSPLCHHTMHYCHNKIRPVLRVQSYFSKSTRPQLVCDTLVQA